LHDLGVEDGESEGTFVNDRGLSDTEWELEELDNMDEFEDGDEDIRTGGMHIVGSYPQQAVGS